jgi:3-hydroxyisobutyrate dehydrogenase-like beta-hydroxyacid dehydrogenase
MTEQIGFIGLGNMGEPMARNLIKAGYALSVYNRTRSRAEPLGKEGAKVVDSPAAAVTPGGIAITMVANDQALDDVTLGEDGLIERLGKGGIHLSMSTISTALANRLSEEHQRRGSTYVAAPVLGRPEAAAAKALNVMLAGPPEAKERVRPVAAAVGQSVWDFGERPSAANAVKLATNYLIMSAMESMAEALALAQKHGVAREDYWGLLSQVMFTSPVHQNYGKAIIEERFEPVGFRLALGFKDIDLALQAAAEARAPMPFASVLRDRLLNGLAKGRGDLDWVALTEGVWEDAAIE